MIVWIMMTMMMIVVVVVVRLVWHIPLPFVIVLLPNCDFDHVSIVGNEYLESEWRRGVYYRIRMMMMMIVAFSWTVVDFQLLTNVDFEEWFQVVSHY